MDHPFEVGKEYRNRNGRYEVLAIDEPKMRIRYQDGSEDTLNINLQARIWNNIQIDASFVQPSAQRPRT